MKPQRQNFFSFKAFCSKMTISGRDDVSEGCTRYVLFNWYLCGDEGDAGEMGNSQMVFNVDINVLLLRILGDWGGPIKCSHCIRELPWEWPFLSSCGVRCGELVVIVDYGDIGRREVRGNGTSEMARGITNLGFIVLSVRVSIMMQRRNDGWFVWWELLRLFVTDGKLARQQRRPWSD